MNLSGSIGGNITSTLYFTYFQMTGVLLAFYLFRKEHVLTKLLLGSVIGSVLLQWIPVVFAFFHDFTVKAHMLAAAVLLIINALLVFLLKPKEGWERGTRQISFKDRKYILLSILMVGMLILWCVLLYTHIIPIGVDGQIYTGQATYGDMSMHLAFITSIAAQGEFPPEYSLFPGTLLAYPFLSDSISSSLYLLGASLRWAYVLPMIAAFAQIMGSVVLLAESILKSVPKTALTFLLFFLNGGLGFTYFLDWSRDGGYTLQDIFTGYYTTPTNLIDHNIRWVNVVADMFLPQRATLFGYAALLPAVWLLHQAVFSEKKKYFPGAAVLAGLLPMIHTHSFLAMGLISAAWLLTDLYRNVVVTEKRKWYGGTILAVFVLLMCGIQQWRKAENVQAFYLLILGALGLTVCTITGIVFLIRYCRFQSLRRLVYTWGVYLLGVMVLALPQLLFWTFGQVAEGGFVRGHFNWGNQGDFYLWFYLKNIGLPLLLIIGAVCHGGEKSRHLILPAGVIWYVSELIVFTPNTYDNNKLLYIAYLLLCIAAADYGVEWYRRICGLKGASVLAGIFLVCTVLSAGLTLAREAVSEYVLYGESAVKLAEYIEQNTRSQDVFLTGTRHNNEVASLTGRSIVCGSDAFLYFHGIDTGQRKAHVEQMYEAPLENQDLYELYHVSYVVISSYERNEYQIEEAIFEEHFEEVFRWGDVKLYRVYPYPKVIFTPNLHFETVR